MPCLQSTTNPHLLPNPGASADDPSWFAIQTRPRHEKKVSTELQGKGISVFLPLVSATRQWSDRRRLVEMPLFPQYVFVRIVQTSPTRISVLRTTGVTSFVGIRGIGLPIPGDQIERVKTVLAHGIPVSPHPFLNVGQRICVRGGALDGVKGILTAVNGDHTLVVSVDLIQKSLAIRLTGYAIEPA
jgi:transcription antitermination factor NusG